MKILLLVLGLILPTAAAFSQEASSPVYSIDENTAENPQYPTLASGMGSVSGFAVLSLQTFSDLANTLALNLLQWHLRADAPSVPTTPYNRTFHFGRWINDPTDETCYNTRAKVLLRDTDGPVRYKETNHCVIESGTWEDPYSARTFNQSRDIQIDHMVPLKDAYTSGAWEWNYQARCLYANFMGNKFHLISSNGTENMRKGDSAPDEYMPPNREYQCQYIENWLKIKLIWRLKMTSSEVSAIKQLVAENHCDVDHFKFSKKDLRQQRDYINDNLGLCPAR
jgi:hypothetical protein